MADEAIDRKKYNAYLQARQLLDSLGYAVISKKEYDAMIAEIERLKNELSSQTLEKAKEPSALDNMRDEIDRLRNDVLNNEKGEKK